MSGKNKILVVDDDKNICELMRLYLEKEGYSTVLAYNGNQASELFKLHKFVLVVLDIMLPGKDGLQVLREIRGAGDTPVIMLTAKGETFNKVMGLDLGADDYIVKPFEAKEFLARVRAVLRRSNVEEQGKKIIELPNLLINIESYDVKVGGKNVDIPPRELELLYFLASNPNKVYTREQLLDDVWGFDYFGDSRTVDVHVKRLREKLETVNENWALKTVWGVGYKFELKV